MRLRRASLDRPCLALPLLPAAIQHCRIAVAELEECAEPGFYFVFQAKGLAPLARAKKFTRGSLWSCGEVAIDEAIRRFRHFMELYGELPWVDQEPIGEFLDDHFPAYTTDL
jgi:hypothetical protein